MAEDKGSKPKKEPPKLQLKNLKPPSKKWLWILIGVVVVAIVVVIIVVAVVSNTGDGAKLVASSTTKASTTTIPTTTTTKLPETTTTLRVEDISDGTYMVGTDIGAGVYKGTVTGGGAFWQISTDANGLDIVAREDVTAQFYLEVKVGQFLRLHNVTISRE